jgi:hypothetical protein
MVKDRRFLSRNGGFVTAGALKRIMFHGISTFKRVKMVGNHAG